jgi:hypothetical protein
MHFLVLAVQEHEESQNFVGGNCPGPTCAFCKASSSSSVSVCNSGFSCVRRCPDVDAVCGQQRRVWHHDVQL